MTKIIFWFSGAGNSLEFGKATIGKRRYHHPRFKAGNLCLRKE